ncbi:MAG: YitT family protein [Oscillospiraceae bacterium]|nr:YitT family protein [Oscillospiraceae bacterium]
MFLSSRLRSDFFIIFFDFSNQTREALTVSNNYLNELKTLSPKNFILLTIAGFINAFGVTVFLSPVKLYDSGISGTSMLLSQITPEYLTLSVFLMILNVPLFIYGLKRQGLAFTVYSVLAVSIYSLGAWLITDVLPVDVSMVSPLAGDDLLLCALFGGIISGTGSGLTIRFGGAIDGVEVMAVIFAKKLNMTVGTFVMVYNVALYILAGIALKSWILPLYSIVTYAAALKTIDYIVEGLDRSKEVMIITNKPDEISYELIKTFECGTTKIAAKGGYSDMDKTVIYFVVNRFQIARMRNIIHTIDPCAYVTISEVADVFKSVAMDKTE